MGRRNLLQIYKEQSSKKLSSNEVQKLADNVYATNFRRLSLHDYIHTRSLYCNTQHMQPCSECTGMLSIANTVARNGYCRLSVSFKKAFPTLSYKTDIARQRVLRMPLACIRLGSTEKGTSAWYLTEYIEGVNYQKFACFAETLVRSECSTPTIHKAEVKALLGLAQSDRERELIRYSVFKASGVSSTKARKSFGFERMNHRATRVEAVLEEVRCIHEAVNDLAHTQDKALLQSMGFILPDSESDSDSDCTCDDPMTTQDYIESPRKGTTAETYLNREHFTASDSVDTLPSIGGLTGTLSSQQSSNVGESQDDHPTSVDNEMTTTFDGSDSTTIFDSLALADLAVCSKWNFLEIVTEIESILDTELTDRCCDTLYSKLESIATTDSENDLLQQSYRAYLVVDNNDDTNFPG